MNRTIWVREISKELCPAWPCPVCRKGTMAMVKDSLLFEETVDSKREHDHHDWDPDWIRYNFTAWAECTHPACKQMFSLSGTGGVSSWYGPEGQCGYEETFVPSACNPMPDIIEIPIKCPKEIAFELRDSFELFLVNLDSCANRIRVAIERLMDHFGIKKRARNKHGKYYHLKLHDRIEQFTVKNPIIGKQLMALKWLGNSGSHRSTISKNDLLDAYEIIEHSLAETIDNRSSRITSLARNLSKKYEPKKRKP